MKQSISLSFTEHQLLRHAISNYIAGLKIDMNRQHEIEAIKLLHAEVKRAEAMKYRLGLLDFTNLFARLEKK